MFRPRGEYRPSPADATSLVSPVRKLSFDAASMFGFRDATGSYALHQMIAARLCVVPSTEGAQVLLGGNALISIARPSQIAPDAAFEDVRGDLIWCRYEHAHLPAASQKLVEAARLVARDVETRVLHYSAGPDISAAAPETRNGLVEAFAGATVLHRLQSGRGIAHGLRSPRAPLGGALRHAARMVRLEVTGALDATADTLLGLQIGEAFLAMAGQGSGVGGLPGVSFTPDEDFSSSAGFDPAWLIAQIDARHIGNAVRVSRSLARVWTQAAQDWPEPRPATAIELNWLEDRV